MGKININTDGGHNFFYGDDDDEDDDDDDQIFDFLTPRESSKPYTVSEINSGIAKILEERNTLVWVEGELSGWKRYPSGHCYFKLKDEHSQIPGVMWKSAAVKLNFNPSDGMAVFAVASIGVYEKAGYYQLSVHRLMPAGAGAQSLAFDKLKAKLLKEGLFDESRKRPLPRSVSALGVVTSKNGAALWDIVRVAAKRAPQTDIIVADTPVQGDTAAENIARSIRVMNDFGGVDVMIVGRGGGSAEDLAAFNEEAVARAIYDSKIPVISAVGHEIDFTIADFVADVRAPTPSAAAETALPDTAEGRRYFEQCSARFAVGINRYFAAINDRIGYVKTSRALTRPARMLAEAERSLDEAGGRIGRSIKSIIMAGDTRLRSVAGRLNSLSPLAVLGRGYSVASDNNGMAIRSVGNVSIGDNVSIRLVDGSVGAEVKSVSTK
ncbi:MAG: exodeoxyribonuclease VII large subunit [Chitinispirillales bacterium]|jgi:exodeoxyribonuclease VII large subunit|nr:exodeoxyribonuclease VII large subunit [Chitinispirillales bacterium]